MTAEGEFLMIPDPIHVDDDVLEVFGLAARDWLRHTKLAPV